MEKLPLRWSASVIVGLVAGVFLLSNLETVEAKEKSIVQLPLGLDAFKVPADNPLTTPKKKLGYRSVTELPQKPNSIGFTMDLDGLAIVADEVKKPITKAINSYTSTNVSPVIIP